MGDWYCYHCDKKVAKAIVWLHIHDIDRVIDTDQCPACKAIWMSQENVKKLREVEVELESK